MDEWSGVPNGVDPNYSWSTSVTPWPSGNFIQILDHEGVLTALDDQGNVWEFSNVIMRWKQLNPDRVFFIPLEDKEDDQE